MSSHANPGEPTINHVKLEKKIPIATVGLLIILFLNLLLTPVQAINWSLDTQLTTDLGWDTDPSIFQTADGTIWVIWASDRVGVQSDLYYKSSANNGASWTPDTRLTFNTAEDTMPSIIQTADKTIWVVWASDRTGNFELFFKTSTDNGVSWTPDTQLTNNPTQDASPSIMQHYNGTIWVVWHRDVAGNYDLYYKTSHDNGLTWSPEKRLTIDPSWDLHPSIIQAFDGTIWVVWTSYRTGNFEVFYKTSTNNGISWSPETQLTTHKDFDEAPSITQVRDGSLRVAWQSDRKGAQYDLYYKTSTDNGLTWSTDTQLTTNSADDMNPTIMNSQEGRIWIAWTSTRTGDFEIFYKTSDIIPVHDVAVVNISLSKTIVGQGYNMRIYVTVKNKGTFTETFSVTAYYNTAAIETKTVTNLAPNAETTLTFSWNTAGVSYGNYIISAYATSVPDETYTVDNTLTNGTVKVTIPGDVNGDGTVNVFDLFAIGKAYGSTPSSPSWNPNADINNDNIVDKPDLSVVEKNYGKTT